MRVIVLFDLPMQSAKNLHEYSRFRKALVRDGFIMMQESVYCKLVLSPSAATLARDRVHKQRPPEGLVQLLTITEKQYAGIEYIVGTKQEGQLEDTQRVYLF